MCLHVSQFIPFDFALLHLHLSQLPCWSWETALPHLAASSWWCTSSILLSTSSATRLLLLPGPIPPYHVVLGPLCLCVWGQPLLLQPWMLGSTFTLFWGLSCCLSPRDLWILSSISNLGLVHFKLFYKASCKSQCFLSIWVSQATAITVCSPISPNAWHGIVWPCTWW